MKERTSSRTDGRLTARRLEWSSVGRASRRHTRIERELGQTIAWPSTRPDARFILDLRGGITMYATGSKKEV